MNDYYIINNVEPFSQIKMNCYFNSLFPVITHYKKDISPFLFSNIQYFSYTSNLKLEVMNFPCYKYSEIFSSMGLSSEFIEVTPNNFINMVCNYISNETFVICKNDLFYNSFSPETFNNKHSKHGLLVYGYNNSRKTFDVIEHDWYNKFTYKHETFSFHDLEKGFFGFCDNFKTLPEINILYKNLSKQSTTSTKDFLKEYSISLLANQMLIDNGLDSLYKFCMDFKQNSISNSYDSLINNAKHLFLVFSYLIIDKNILYEALNKNFDNCNKIFSNTFTLLISKYNFIRAVIYKVMYTEKVNIKMILKCSEILFEIYKHEVILSKELLRFLNNIELIKKNRS